MDGFFNKYGRVIIIAVAICFVLLYLTPMRNVVGSSINGFAGNFANKVGDSLGTVKMPNGSDNVAWETPDGIEVGKSIKIDGTTYTIMKQTGNNKFLVYKYFNFNIAPDFNDSKRGKDDYNIYEGSDIDNYLEKTYYSSLSDKLKNAIELTEIKQSSYELEETPQYKVNIDTKYDTNYKGQKYNILKRHVYLPSVEDLVEDLNNPGKYIGKKTIPLCTRDAIHSCNNKMVQYYSNNGNPLFVDTDGTPGGSVVPVPIKYTMCSSFIVDLSKVDYELVK